MITSFSIKPDDEKSISIIKKVKNYCMLHDINFSAFVVTAIKKHFNDIKGS